MEKYAKTIVAALFAVATALSTVLEDNQIAANEWLTVALALLSALGVYSISNGKSVAVVPPQRDGEPTS